MKKSFLAPIPFVYQYKNVLTFFIQINVVDVNLSNFGTLSWLVCVER